MTYHFKIIKQQDFNTIIPLVYALNEEKVALVELTLRFNEMKLQNYECAGIFNTNDKLIGVSGLWFCTRHYSGRSVELDHVYIKPEYRNNGLGQKFILWIEDYVKSKGYQTIELNTYVQNYASHKFYYNKGYEILGYHFLKRL